MVPKKESDGFLDNKEKEHRFASGGIIEWKEVNGELVISGYIATTHKDSVNDIITKEALEKWATEINQGIPRVNKVSYHHDRGDPRSVGVGVKGSARVDQLPDGEFGLWVDTVVNKSHDLYDNIEYEYSIDALDSFSIEFKTDDGAKSDDSVRVLDTSTTLHGWTLASRPVNDHAVMIKELLSRSNGDIKQNKNSQEVETMEKEDNVKLADLQVQLKEMQAKLQAKEEADAEAAKTTEEEKANAEAEEKEKSRILGIEKKESELKDQIAQLKEVISKVGESNKAKLDVENKEDKFLPEFKELKEVVSKPFGYKEAAHSLGRYWAKRGLEGKENFSALSLTPELSLAEVQEKVVVKRIEGKEVLQFKALGVGSNINAAYVDDTSNIGLSQAELQDTVMPVIFNALNESTVTWDLLSKDVGGSDGSNRVTFVLKTGNTGAYFSTSNAITMTTTSRIKYTTEYKKLYIGGSVDGDLQVYSKGGPFGEALALEMADRAIALKVEANQALFDENDGEQGDAEPLGIPAITDSAGNTSLYNTTRSTANKLSPDAAGDTYVDGSGGLTEPLLRNAIEQATTDGSQLGDLMFVGTPAVVNKYKALFDNRERLVPYSDRAGFASAPDYEGVPLFADKDSKASSLFLLDTKALRAKIVQPATPEMLGKRSDSHEFFIKQYYAIYCTAPRRLVEIYSIA